MRNLRDYPITKEEIIAFLVNLADKYATDGGIGDIRPSLLREAAKHVRGSTVELTNLGTVQARSQKVG